MPTPEYHALLSPSSAARWLHCPVSVMLSKDIPQQTSEYAERGRLAHAIAELKARKKFTPLSKRTYDSQLKKLKNDPLYLKEMDGYTNTYVEVLEEHAMTFQNCPFTALESSVPVGAWTGENKADGAPATGTADCIQIGEGVLWVTDYKNGQGVQVSAEENPQMMIYGLGALLLYAPVYGDTIQTVRLTIVQPALGSKSDWEISRKDLEVWGENVLKPAAAKALAGEGEPCPGEWCKSHFCPLRGCCRARSKEYLAMEAFKDTLPAGALTVNEKIQHDIAASAGADVPPLLSDIEVGGILKRAEGIVAWVKDLQDYALKACLEGREIPGWKAVEGRSNRAFADQDAALEIIKKAGYDEALIYNRVPLSLSELEKLIGKKEFAKLMGDQIVKPAGKPTLASADDRRPVYNGAALAFSTEAGNG